MMTTEELETLNFGQRIKSLIQENAALKKLTWVSVKDALPKEMVDVFVVHEKGDIEVCWYEGRMWASELGDWNPVVLWSYPPELPEEKNE